MPHSFVQLSSAKAVAMTLAHYSANAGTVVENGHVRANDAGGLCDTGLKLTAHTRLPK